MFTKNSIDNTITGSYQHFITDVLEQMIKQCHFTKINPFKNCSPYSIAKFINISDRNTYDLNLTRIYISAQIYIVPFFLIILIKNRLPDYCIGERNIIS